MFIKIYPEFKKLFYIYLILISSEIQAKEKLFDEENKSNIQQVSIKTERKIKVAIIDSIFDSESDTKNTLSDSTKRELKNKSFGEFLTKRENHANHVASIIHRNALGKAELRILPYVSQKGNNDIDRLVYSIDKAVKSKVNFINISLKISYDENFEIDKKLRKAFLRARDAGIAIIKSAGNDREVMGTTPYTKSLSNLLYEMKGSMIIVTSINNQEKLSNFSNRAGEASIYCVSAAGENIEAYGANNKIMAMSGTSMAAPKVTAKAVLIKERYPELSNKEVLVHILQSARTEDVRGNTLSLNDYGLGILD